MRSDFSEDQASNLVAKPARRKRVSGRTNLVLSEHDRFTVEWAASAAAHGQIRFNRREMAYYGIRYPLALFWGFLMVV